MVPVSHLGVHIFLPLPRKKKAPLILSLVSYHPPFLRFQSRQMLQIFLKHTMSVDGNTSTVHPRKTYVIAFRSQVGPGAMQILLCKHVHFFRPKFM